MIQALTKSLGIVTLAAKEVGIANSTHYDWLKDDEEYRKDVDGIADVAIDFVESKLHKNIDQGDTTAQIFYLKTKGKKRGYIERTEFDIFEKEINIQVDIPEHIIAECKK